MTMRCGNCGQYGIRWMGPLSNLTRTECPHCGGTNCQESDAALLQQICDKMAEVVAPLPGIPDAPGQHAGTRAIEPSDGDKR